MGAVVGLAMVVGVLVYFVRRGAVADEEGVPEPVLSAEDYRKIRIEGAQGSYGVGSEGSDPSFPPPPPFPTSDGGDMSPRPLSHSVE